MPHLKKRITKSTVFKMTGFDEPSLDKAIADGTFPAPVHVGKKSLWRAFDVVDWVVDNVVSAAYLSRRLKSKQ